MRCTAKAKSSGKRCRRQSILGARVCYVHGGASPQVRRSARERLALLVDPALARIAKVLKEGEDVVAVRAAIFLLDKFIERSPSCGGRRALPVAERRGPGREDRRATAGAREVGVVDPTGRVIARGDAVVEWEHSRRQRCRRDAGRRGPRRGDAVTAEEVAELVASLKERAVKFEVTGERVRLTPASAVTSPSSPPCVNTGRR